MVKHTRSIRYDGAACSVSALSFPQSYVLLFAVMCNLFLTLDLVFFLFFSNLAPFVHFVKDITCLVGRRTLQQHTRFPTLNKQVATVMEDIGKLRFDKFIRGEDRCLQDDREAVFDVF